MLFAALEFTDFAIIAAIVALLTGGAAGGVPSYLPRATAAVCSGSRTSSISS